MTIGFIGLGKMGANMTKRLVEAGHKVLAYDPNPDARITAANGGVETYESRSALLVALEQQIVWLMIPPEYVDDELDALLDEVNDDAIVIDGGNSDYRLSIKRAARAAERNVAFIDIGTSGGILGPERGYAMMVGGDKNSVKKLNPILNDLAPTDGWDYFGPSGSGHFVKMAHNAIEYGLMQSYAEGYQLLKDGPFKDIDLAAAASVWQNGSIIQSLLNQLATKTLTKNPKLDGIDGIVAESGETRWALEVADKHDVTLPAIKAAFQARLDSQDGQINFATKLVAALRNQFGGHDLNEGSKQ